MTLVQVLKCSIYRRMINTPRLLCKANVRITFATLLLFMITQSNSKAYNSIFNVFNQEFFEKKKRFHA